MKIIFMGTPTFAVPSLRTLAGSHHNILAVVAQPDRPKGRHLHHPLPPPVKKLAQELGLRVIQTPNVNDPDIVRELRALAPDIIVVIAFGQRLSKEFLDIPGLACINLHASLLPKYRGAAPINWAIIKGEEVTGVTALKVIEKMDAGDIIAQESVEVMPEETAGELEDRLSKLAPGLLMRVLEAYELSSVHYQPQKEELVTQAPKLEKHHGIINWAQEAKRVHDFIRGMNPRPGAYSFLASSAPSERWMALSSEDSHTKKRFTILQTQLRPGQPKRTERPGTILTVSQEGIEVATQEGSIWITLLQPEGGRIMTAAEYLRGHKLHPGECFVSEA
jgi:methionyl-tRNA formyltransferase